MKYVKTIPKQPDIKLYGFLMEDGKISLPLLDDALEHNTLDVVQLQDMYRFCFDYSITVNASIKLAMEGNPVKLENSDVTPEGSMEIIESMLDRIQTRLEERGGTPEFMFNHVPQIETIVFEK